MPLTSHVTRDFDQLSDVATSLVHQAWTVVLLANGPRKTGPIAESILGEFITWGPDTGHLE